MSQGGPWSPAPEPPPPPLRRRPRRLWLALGAGATVAALAWGLSRLAAGQMLTLEDWGYVGSRVLLVVLVVSAALARGFNLASAAKNALLWFAIIAALVLAYSFRDAFGSVANRLRSEIAPAFGVEARTGELTVGRADDGHFYVMGAVNGAPVRFLIDTGASDVVLSPQDARRIGVNLAALDFSRSYGTANGVGHGARYVAQSLSVGSLTRTDVEMAVNGAPMGASLLGMSFFRGLESVEIRGSRLYLRWSG